MLTLSQKLPDYFEYYEDGTQYYLRQVQYPQDIPLLHQWMHEPHVIPQWQLNKCSQAALTSGYVAKVEGALIVLSAIAIYSTHTATQ